MEEGEGDGLAFFLSFPLEGQWQCMPVRLAERVETEVFVTKNGRGEFDANPSVNSQFILLQNLRNKNVV